MSEPSLGSSAAVDNSRPTTMAAREAGLQRNLTPAQLAMLGLGSTIGTGLFLGSAIAVKLAGPAVILSFIACGFGPLPMVFGPAVKGPGAPGGRIIWLFAG